jgi:membrane protein putatively involved in post-translational modification of the autoinducing quorum-sensing peptide
MKSISASIAYILWDQGIIQKEDINKCRYGLDIFISSALEIVSILIIAAVIGNFLQTLLLFAAFIPLRIYAGGYHSDTKLKCYLVSLGVYGIFTIVMQLLSAEIYLIVAVSATVFSMLMILIAAPIIHKNKSVNDIERKYYRKFSIGICSVETAIVLVSAAIFPESRFIVSLAIGQVTVAFSMIAAIIKGKMAEN